MCPRTEQISATTFEATTSCELLETSEVHVWKEFQCDDQSVSSLWNSCQLLEFGCPAVHRLEGVSWMCSTFKSSADKKCCQLRYEGLKSPSHCHACAALPDTQLLSWSGQRSLLARTLLTSSHMSLPLSGHVQHAAVIMVWCDCFVFRIHA